MRRERRQGLQQINHLIHRAVYKSWPTKILELEWDEHLLDKQITRSFALKLIARRLENLKKDWITLQNEKEAYEEYKNLATDDYERQTLEKIFDLQGSLQHWHEKTSFLEDTLKKMHNDNQFIPPSCEAIPWEGTHSHEIKILQIESELNLLCWLNGKSSYTFAVAWKMITDKVEKETFPDLCKLLSKSISPIYCNEIVTALRELKAWNKQHGEKGDILEQAAWETIEAHKKENRANTIHFLRKAHEYKQRLGITKI